MKVNKTVQVKITLDLSVDEAMFIKNLTQNYLADGVEAETDSKLREGIFNGLKIALSEAKYEH